QKGKDSFARPYIDMALIYLKQNKEEKAEKVVLEALSLCPDNKKSHSTLGFIYLQKGIIFFLSKNLRLAKKYFVLSLREQKFIPGDYLAILYFHLAMVLTIEKRPRLAKVMFNAAFKEPGIQDLAWCYAPCKEETSVRDVLGSLAADSKYSCRERMLAAKFIKENEPGYAGILAEDLKKAAISELQEVNEKTSREHIIIARVLAPDSQEILRVEKITTKFKKACQSQANNDIARAKALFNQIAQELGGLPSGTRLANRLEILEKEHDAAVLLAGKFQEAGELIRLASLQENKGKIIKAHNNFTKAVLLLKGLKRQGVLELNQIANQGAQRTEGKIDIEYVRPEQEVSFKQGNGVVEEEVETRNTKSAQHNVTYDVYLTEDVVGWINRFWFSDRGQFLRILAPLKKIRNAAAHLSLSKDPFPDKYKEVTLYRFKQKNYRVIYILTNDKKCIVLAIGNRQDIYRNIVMIAETALRYMRGNGNNLTPFSQINKLYGASSPVATFTPEVFSAENRGRPVPGLGSSPVKEKRGLANILTRLFQTYALERRNSKQFLKDIKRSVIFFGSARIGPKEDLYNWVVELSRLVGKACKDKKIQAIITGSGPGLMEAANKGARISGIKSYGLNITISTEQFPNPYADRALYFSYFFTRKIAFLRTAEVIIVLPGGFGTMDELIEALLLKARGRLNNIPIILIN
ncbi:MAG: LOG family protein, partial [Candidatus Omnitrophica bacterium]|nr:LOG family protein [Candidatus Omnitrophota bacterium]